MPNASYKDFSGTVTTGGTSQKVADANGGRHAFYFQNLSSGDLYLNFGTDASATNSLKCTSGQSLSAAGEGCPVDALYVFGATTGQAYCLKLA